MRLHALLAQQPVTGSSSLQAAAGAASPGREPRRQGRSVSGRECALALARPRVLQLSCDACMQVPQPASSADPSFQPSVPRVLARPNSSAAEARSAGAADVAAQHSAPFAEFERAVLGEGDGEPRPGDALRLSRASVSALLTALSSKGHVAERAALAATAGATSTSRPAEPSEGGEELGSDGRASTIAWGAYPKVRVAAAAQETTIVLTLLPAESCSALHRCVWRTAASSWRDDVVRREVAG